MRGGPTSSCFGGRAPWSDRSSAFVRPLLPITRSSPHRYCVGTIVSISAVGLGLLRLVI